MSALTCPLAKAISGFLVSRFFPLKEGFDFGCFDPVIYSQE